MHPGLLCKHLSLHEVCASIFLRHYRRRSCAEQETDLSPRLSHPEYVCAFPFALHSAVSVSVHSPSSPCGLIFVPSWCLNHDDRFSGHHTCGHQMFIHPAAARMRQAAIWAKPDPCILPVPAPECSRHIEEWKSYLSENHVHISPFRNFYLYLRRGYLFHVILEVI